MRMNKNTGYNCMVDWWSLGILLHEMVVGKAPFSTDNAARVMKDIVTFRYRPPDSMSINLKRLIGALLRKDPTQRLGSPQNGGISSIKEHPFFEGLDWSRVLKKGYQPPIKPSVTKANDVAHIDSDLLKEEMTRS